MEKMTNKEFIATMHKSLTTLQERVELQRKRRAEYARSAFSFNTAISAHAVAGFPRLLALPAPAVGGGVR